MPGETPQLDRSNPGDIDDRAHATKAKGMWLVLAVAALFATAALTIIYSPKQPAGAVEPDEVPPVLKDVNGK